MEQRRLAGTGNYVYNLDDLIGKGATCEVFKGIHTVRFVCIIGLYFEFDTDIFHFL